MKGLGEWFRFRERRHHINTVPPTIHPLKPPLHLDIFQNNIMHFVMYLDRNPTLLHNHHLGEFMSDPFSAPTFFPIPSLEGKMPFGILWKPSNELFMINQGKQVSPFPLSGFFSFILLSCQIETTLEFFLASSFAKYFILSFP